MRGPAQLARVAPVEPLQVGQGLLGLLHVQQHGGQEELVRLDRGVELAQIAIEYALGALEVLQPGPGAAEHGRRVEVLGLTLDDRLELADGRRVLPSHDEDIGHAAAQHGVARPHGDGLLVHLLRAAHAPLTDEQARVLDADLLVVGELQQVAVEEVQRLREVAEREGVARRAQEQLLLRCALQRHVVEGSSAGGQARAAGGGARSAGLLNAQAGGRRSRNRRCGAPDEGAVRSGGGHRGRREAFGRGLPCDGAAGRQSNGSGEGHRDERRAGSGGGELH